MRHTVQRQSTATPPYSRQPGRPPAHPASWADLQPSSTACISGRKGRRAICGPLATAISGQPRTLTRMKVPSSVALTTVRNTSSKMVLRVRATREAGRRSYRRTQDRRKSPWTQLIMQGNDHSPRAPAQLAVASLGTDDVKAVLLKGAHYPGTGDDRQPLGAYAESRTSTGATIGSGASGAGWSSKYSSSASPKLASASSMVRPWLATSTSRQRATYQSPSGVTAAVSLTVRPII